MSNIKKIYQMEFNLDSPGVETKEAFEKIYGAKDKKGNRIYNINVDHYWREIVRVKKTLKKEPEKKTIEAPKKS